MLPIKRSGQVKRKFKPPARIGVGLNEASKRPVGSMEQENLSTKKVAKKEEFEVLYAKKGPKKRILWHDGILQAQGIERWLLLSRENRSIISSASGTLTAAAAGSENEKLFAGYKLQFEQDVGQVRREPLVEVKACGMGLKAARVKLPQQGSTAFSAPVRVGHGTKGQDAHRFILQENPHVSLAGSIVTRIRPHQGEAVQFLYRALCDKGGAILADDMGLGKTLTTLLLLRVLAKAALCVNHDLKCRKLRKAVILCPATLVMQWIRENIKWFGSVSSNMEFIAAIETPGAKYDGTSMRPQDAISHWNALDASKGCKVLIVSYETSLRHADTIFHEPQLDALIMDEGHRLKSAASKITKQVRSSRAKKRLLITGTPAMNNLEEFFVLADCVNPNIFGDIKHFKSKYIKAIDRASKRDASAATVQAGQEAQDSIRAIARPFFLRRIATDIKRDSMPPKTVHYVSCLMTPSQRNAYLEVCQAATKASFSFDGTDILTQLQRLRALATRGDYQASSETPAIDFTTVSGKLAALISLLEAIIQKSNDKIVLVSTSTQTLDVLKQICEARRWGFLRLDGTTAADERTSIVTRFNSTTNPNRIFLLSSRAGGCGVNLIGANRLVLVDADWNPALDEQAMARVWRDGQKKDVHIYRFLTRASIDEVMVQRQFAKHDLADGVIDGAAINGRFSTDQLKDLFTLNETQPSSIAAALNWPKYLGPDTLIDNALRFAALNAPGVITYVRSINASAPSSAEPTPSILEVTQTQIKPPIQRRPIDDNLSDLADLDAFSSASASVSAEGSDADDSEYVYDLESAPVARKKKLATSKKRAIEDEDEDEFMFSPSPLSECKKKKRRVIDDDCDDFDDDF